MTGLLALVILGQLDVYNQGAYVGRSANAVDCFSSATCTITGDGGSKRVRVTASGGGSLPAPPVCNDGGVALGWDGGVFVCITNIATATALKNNPTDCSAGAYATSIDSSGNLTCTTAAPVPSWAEVTLSAAQSTSLSVGHHVRFDVTRMDGGSLIFPDLTTTYTTTNNVASLGRVRVLAGHVYRLMFFHGFCDFPGGGYAHFTMWDTTANVAIGQSVQIQSDSTTYGNWGGGYLHSYYQPSADSWIEVRITAGGPNSIGVVSTGNHFPTWLIESIN